jgi:carbohydrate-selective porin OprB
MPFPRIRSSIAVLSLTACCLAQNSPLDRSFASLDRRGLSFSLDYFGDGFVGYPSAPSTYATGFLDLAATLDLSRILPPWKGGTLFASLHHTTHSTDVSAGELQLVSNLDDVRRSVLAEVWIVQSLSRRASVRFGKIDANRDFAFVESGFDFLNASFSFSPTVISMPTYGDTRWGAELLISHQHHWVNLAAFRPTHGGVLPIAEAGVKWAPLGMSGRAGFGYWCDTTVIQNFSGRRRSFTSGVYMVMEQSIWKDSRNTQSVSAFIQHGTAPDDLSLITRHLGGGILWNSPFRHRANDAAGLAVSIGQLTRHPEVALRYHHETVYEVFYRIGLHKQVAIVPDLQYIFHPGGLPDSPNIFVAGARLKFSFNTHEKE